MPQHGSRSRPTSPFKAQSPYIFPSPIVPSSQDQQAPSLNRNQSVTDQQNAGMRNGLRRTRSFITSDSNNTNNNAATAMALSGYQQPADSRPPLRFYVDDAIHELFSHKQKGKSKHGAFGLITSLFACWNPNKKGNQQDSARSVSASKRVAELLEISRRQQTELADKQDTIDMLEWQLEQLQAMTFMDNELRDPPRRSTASTHGFPVLPDKDDGGFISIRQDKEPPESHQTSHNCNTESQQTTDDYSPESESRGKSNNDSSSHAKLVEHLQPNVSKLKIEEDTHALKTTPEEHINSRSNESIHAQKPKLEEKVHPLRLNAEDRQFSEHQKQDVEDKDKKHPNDAKIMKLKSELEAVDMENNMATLLLFEMATMRARFSIRSFSKALIKQMEASGYSVLRTLSELEPNVVFTRKEHVVYTLESRINKAFFHCFENDSFDDSGLMQILDPVVRCATRLEEFQRMKLIEVDDAVNVNHPLFDAEFRRFCQRKTRELWSQFTWSIVFNNIEEREVFTAAFLDAAKSVWLLHRLAFSVNPHVLILRVGKGLEIDPVYVEAVPNLDGGRCPQCSKSKVEFLIMPGFQAMDKVVKCQIYQHVRCNVD